MGIKTVLYNEEVKLKNRIINGGFDFWQRGISNANFANGFLADRFYYNADTGTTTEHTRQEDVPTELAELGLRYSSKLERDVAVAVTNTTKNIYRHAIEGNFVEDLIGKDVVFSFWVKCNRPRTQSFRFVNSASSRSYIAEYTIDQADTWEKKTFRFNLEDNVYNSGIDNCVTITFGLDVGSDFHGVEGWQGLNGLSNFPAGTATQDSIFGDGANNYIQFAGIMFSEDDGLEDVVFQRAGRDYAEELQLCQRYFVSQFYNIYQPIFGGAVWRGGSSSTATTNFLLPVEMRDAPILTWIGSTPDTSISTNTLAQSISAISGWGVTSNGGNSYTVGITKNFANNGLYTVHDYNGSATAHFDAEL
jgi:hypothetical protein